MAWAGVQSAITRNPAGRRVTQRGVPFQFFETRSRIEKADWNLFPMNEPDCGGRKSLPPLPEKHSNLSKRTDGVRFCGILCRYLSAKVYRLCSVRVPCAGSDEAEWWGLSLVFSTPWLHLSQLTTRGTPVLHRPGMKPPEPFLFQAGPFCGKSVTANPAASHFQRKTRGFCRVHPLSHPLRIPFRIASITGSVALFCGSPRESAASGLRHSRESCGRPRASWRARGLSNPVRDPSEAVDVASVARRLD